MIRFEEITMENFSTNALEGFVRHQEVYECWRQIDGVWRLQPVRFTESWGEEKLREMEDDIIKMLPHGFGFLALCGGSVVGFTLVDASPIGEQGEYMELTDFQVSKPYRRKGIGKELFRRTAEKAKAKGAKKLYISAHSSKESQAAYRAIGCTDALWLYDKKIAEEPFDVQMEYLLDNSEK